MANPSVQSAGAVDSGSGSCTPPIPTGTANGSMLVAAIGCLPDGDIATPTGYTNKILDDDQSPGVALHFKKLTATETSTTAMSCGGGLSNGGGMLIRVEDEDPAADPFGPTTSASNASSATTPAVSLTGLPTGALAIWICASSVTRDVSSGMAENGWTRHETAGGQRVHMWSKAFPSGGDTGTVQATMSGSSGHTAALTYIKPDPALSGTATARSETATTTATGVVGKTTTATAVAETATLSASGQVGTSAGASVTETVGITATGSVSRSADATDVAETVTITATGDVSTGPEAELAVTATTSAAGRLDTQSDSTVAEVVALSASGVVGKSAGASLQISVALTAQTDKAAGAELAIGATVTAEGVRTRVFEPPTQLQSMPHRFWGRYSIPVGISVLRVDGHFVNVVTPTNDELVAAGVEGVDFFRGGYRYEPDEDVWLDLVADGYVPADP